jgi:hypothetical protein
MGEQLELMACQKEWPGYTFERSINYAHAEVMMGIAHRGFGWVWDSRLMVKEARGVEDEDCHVDLFGDLAYSVRFRGWFNYDTGVLLFCDRQREVRGPDEIPSMIYSHLSRRFPLTATKIRIT